MRVSLTVGEMVHIYRIRRGLTINGLSRICGVTSQQIMSIEKGRNQPRMDTFLKIIRGMDYDIALVDAKRKK